MTFSALKEECLAANLDLPTTGLVDLTFGNVSVADPERGVFVIKPSGVSYGDLRADHIVVLDFEGNVIEGSLRPSSDTPTHRYLYRHFSGVRSVVHTHSRNAVAFAQAGMDLPCLGTTHCDYFNGPVPVTRAMTREETGGEYEWETGKVIVERFRDIDPLELPAVLVRNHGPFAWGVTAAKAIETAVALEAIADMALKTLLLNPSAEAAPAYLRTRHFFRKHGSSAYYGQVNRPLPD
ncbi:L-ribulose-5-phosphate 4-epimerase AraD [Luteolibacter arcticus]|uniref:L-ribulose-5-phosphate 4-epimerase n=1 Tax=Luteolibacter arcticus TaxID=1581411 RepID=A0ABT3GK89_9BACT|nr:L-ribulose-5-phosphate 4-epimerase AraD [Luteolibacter arcticus]MCW1923911.1 L-ribulose-5-phosphate 4-epimerase AraD [Luteolibacter arcticus]